MNYNYHTHTHRCGHATGTEEEYILNAIEGGIAYMGFSDHAPLKFEDGFESSYRVPTAKAQNYIENVKALGGKYKDKIDIKVGFEMEYYPRLFDTMLKNAVNMGAEYLILGQHFLGEEHPKAQHSILPTEDIADLERYVFLVSEAIKTGAFTYIAHPDMFNFTGDISVYKKEMRKICEASKEYGIPLEINFLGIRDNRIYPNDKFLAIAGEVGCPVTFGFDAHDAKAACDRESLAKAKELVLKYNLNYIGKPEIIFINSL